jgi:hypothetical protein
VHKRLATMVDLTQLTMAGLEVVVQRKLGKT